MSTIKPPTLELIRAAREEHARVYKLNRPAFAANKAIRLRNWEREHGFRDDPREPWIEYVAVEEWALDAYRAELAWKRELQRRRPGTWRELILALPEEGVRIWVANIVWWDYFADRTMSDRWPELDQWLDVPAEKLCEREDDESRGALEMALLAVGYSGWEANRRAWGGQEDLTENRRRNFGGHHHGRVGRRFVAGAGRGMADEHPEGVRVGVMV